MCINGTWGYVCDNDWDSNDAEVVCKQLGYSTSNVTAIHYAQLQFRQGNISTYIYMDDVSCIGNESSLISCNFTRDHNCHHYEDAGVRCGGSKF